LTQYILTLLILYSIIQSYLSAYYNTTLLMSIFLLSYGLSCISLGILAVRFFLWFKVRRSFSILMYGLTSALFVLSNLFLMYLVTLLLGNVSEFIQSHGHVGLYTGNPNSIQYLLYNGYGISSLLSFVITWVATVSILYYYSRKIKFWIVMSLPLVYFLNQFNPLLLEILFPVIEDNLILYLVIITIVLSIGKAAGGIFYGFAFWKMGERTRELHKLMPYLILVAIGFMYLFIAERGLYLLELPFPPFGFISIGTLGLSSYLILIGLYYAVVSISTDVDLRKSIRTSTIQELSLIGKIGSVEINKELEHTVRTILTKNLSDEQPEANFSSEEIKDYVDDVMTAIKKMRESNNQH